MTNPEIKPSKFIQAIEPYKITPQDVWSDLAPKDLLKLDWNEAPEDLTVYLKGLKKIVSERGHLSWYPDYLSLELTNIIAEFNGIPANNVLTFPGSDVGLETLCRTYLDPEDEVVVLTPTYENFFIYVLQTGAKLVELKLDKPFKFNLQDVISRIENGGKTKILYLVRPNNPCGYMISKEDIIHLSSTFPETLIVVDEAYIEFSENSSMAEFIDSYSNIVCFRTFSKAFGLAGLRLGYMCAPESVIRNVSKIRNGKNVTMIAQKMGIFALKNFLTIEKWINEVISSREMFCKWCEINEIKYYPSKGNFVLFEVRKPNELHSHLKSLGIYIRNRSSLIQSAVRVTIGSKKNTQRLIKALESMPQLLK